MFTIRQALENRVLIEKTISKNGSILFWWPNSIQYHNRIKEVARIHFGVKLNDSKANMLSGIVWLRVREGWNPALAPTRVVAKVISAVVYATTGNHLIFRKESVGGAQ